jgi:hypothetical protein
LEQPKNSSQQATFFPTSDFFPDTLQALPSNQITATTLNFCHRSISGLHQWLTKGY